MNKIKINDLVRCQILLDRHTYNNLINHVMRLKKKGDRANNSDITRKALRKYLK